MEGDPAGVQVRGSEPPLSRAWNAPPPPAPARAAAAGGPVRRPRRGLSLPSITFSSPCSPSAFKVAPVGGRDSAGALGAAGGARRSGAEAAARSGRAGRSRRRPGFTPAGKEPGSRAWLRETRRSSRLLARISCAWMLFRKMRFIRGVFLKAPPRPVMLTVRLEENSALPPGSHPKHISS